MPLVAALPVGPKAQHHILLAVCERGGQITSPSARATVDYVKSLAGHSCTGLLLLSIRGHQVQLPCRAGDALVDRPQSGDWREAHAAAHQNRRTFGRKGARAGIPVAQVLSSLVYAGASRPSVGKHVSGEY